MKFEAALTELAQLWGINLPIGSDAIEITDSKNGLWILECAKQSDMFTLYTHLDIAIDPKNMDYWLNINMQRGLLGSSWIGLDEGRLCLGLSLPKDKLDHIELNNIFENMFLIKEKLYLLDPNDKIGDIDKVLTNRNQSFKWC